MNMRGKINRATPLILIIWAVALSFVVFYTGYVYYVDSPVSTEPQQEPITVEISKGDSFTSVMNVLEEVGLIKHTKSFYLLAILRGAPKHIRAGEYELDASMTPREILDKFLKGEIKGYRIPIPEGFTVRQIASRLSHWRLVNEEKFMERAYNKDFLASLYIPGDSIEGYLFPDTYILTRSMGEEEIMRFMVRRFRQKVTSTMMKRGGELGFTVEEILILASIIEKEGGVNEEKPLVAAVFHNRLKKGMRLQSDPTVIYGIKKFDGNLTKKHLKKTTRYNTYRIKGLPPGPICNPGIDSIMAALYPAPVDYLFFVSKNDGSHHFSADLASHNKAVIKYQIKRRR
jgi:UPF0755 protein